MKEQTMPFTENADAIKSAQTVVTKEEPKKEAAIEVAKPAVPQVLISAGLMRCFSQPKKAFLSAGGTEEQFARETNFAMQSLLKNEYLVDCAKKHPDFLVEAIKNVGLTGLTLNPELKLGYLVPYKGKIFFQSSYMGKKEILIRTGVVKWIEANLVYDKDQFEVHKGTQAGIIHIPDYFSMDRGNIKGGYWTAVLPDGNTVFDVMPLSRIEEIKSRSESVKSGKGSAWDTDFEEMARKTIINWAYKSLPKTGISDSILKALEADSGYDNEVQEDWKATQEQQKKGAPDKFDDDTSFVQYEEVK